MRSTRSVESYAQMWVRVLKRRWSSSTPKVVHLYPGRASLTNPVSESLALEQEFVKAKDAVGDIVETIAKLVKLIENVLDALEAIPDANSLIDLIKSGELKKIADIGKALQIGKDLPKLVHDLTQALPTVTDFVVRLEQQGPKLLNSLNEIVSNVWLDDPQVTNEAAKNGRESILRIQTLFRGQILSILRDLRTKSTRIYSALTSLPFHGRSLSIDVNVASYQRWSPISFDLPCTRTARKKYTVAGGFSGSFDYPEFYSCPYSNKIEWPNHHIPYLKLRFGGPTAHQLASFAAFAPDANAAEDGNGGAAASNSAAPMPTVTFAPDAVPAPSTTGAAPPNPTNAASFRFTAPPNSTTNVNGTSSSEGQTTYPALVGNSTTGGAKVAVTYFGNGSFAGQFEEVEGEDVGVQM